MSMARGIDSDYIDLSLMGGFDMGIDFDGFEENVKKFMELPIKYLDSAHDKAVELIEDVHAMLWSPCPDTEVPNKRHETFKDPSNSSVISGSSLKSVEKKLVEPHTEVRTPASLITVESSFTGCVNTNADETELGLTKSPENISSKGDHIEANDLCLLPVGTSTTEIYDSTTSEEIILWNPGISSKKPSQPLDPTTISEDDYVPHTLDTDKVTQQDGLHCSGHSDIRVESSVLYGAVPLANSNENYEEQTVIHNANDPMEATAYDMISYDLSADVPRCADDRKMCRDDMIKLIRLRNDQGYIKFEDSYVQLQQNTSFKKMFMRNLSSKLRWSKKQTSAHEAMPARSQDGDNLGYQVVSSSGDLEDDWEVVS